MFKPGTTANDVNRGYYTQALGLGLNPTMFTINGGLHVQTGRGALVNFWSGAETRR